MESVKSPATDPRANAQPNILFITSDQHRWDSLGCAGRRCVRTPHLDRLAYEGVRFEDAYLDCPVCIGSLMTQAGYQTALVGKRHWHTDRLFKAGFEAVISIERCKRKQQLHGRRDGYVFSLGANELHSTLSPIPPELYGTDWIVDQYIEIAPKGGVSRDL